MGNHMEQGSEDKARIAQKLGIVFATLPPIILQYATSPFFAFSVPPCFPYNIWN